MIKIYFDNTLVDSDNYISIRNVYKIFDDSFLLGSNSANTIELEVPSSIQLPSEVKIQDDSGDYGYFIVDKYEYKDNNVFEKGYSAKDIIDEKADLGEDCTLLDVLEDICDKFGVTLGTNSFVNDDEVITFYDNTITAREYISYIAELNGGFAQIGKDGKLYLRQFVNGPSITLDSEECEDFKLGEHHEIERVVFDNGELHFETDSDETKETLYLNSANVFINNQAQFTATANAILGFEFYNFETGNSPIDTSVQAGGLLEISLNNNTYTSIVQYDIKYNGGWLGGYELDLNSEIQEETKVLGPEQQIKSLKIIVDRDRNTITRVVREVEGGEGQEGLIAKESRTEQRVDSINTSVYEIQNGYFGYHLTTDTTFGSNEQYYCYIGGNYELLEWDSTNNTYTDSYGDVYEVGDTIPDNFIYEQDTNLTIGLNDLRTQVTQLQGSWIFQQGGNIEELFINQTAYNNMLEDINTLLNGQGDDDPNAIKNLLISLGQYIRRGVSDEEPTQTSDTTYQSGKRYFKKENGVYIELYPITSDNPNGDYVINSAITGTIYESEHYQRSYLILGGADNPNTIEIWPDVINFTTHGTITAYLKNNALYIEESTILKKERIGHWETSEDALHNLNTRWVGDN